MLSLSRLAICLVVFAGPGCHLSHSPEPEEGSHDPRFVGDWLVIGAAGWALLPTETVYRFGATGSVEIVRHEPGSYFPEDVGAAAWSTEPGDSICEFGESWWSEDSEHIQVDAVCSAGAEGSEFVRLHFPGPASANSTTANPEIVEPIGARSAWELYGIFRRCDDDCDSW